jgi:hypothetical protein
VARGDANAILPPVERARPMAGRITPKQAAVGSSSNNNDDQESTRLPNERSQDQSIHPLLLPLTATVWRVGCLKYVKGEFNKLPNTAASVPAANQREGLFPGGISFNMERMSLSMRNLE